MTVGVTAEDWACQYVQSQAQNRSVSSAELTVGKILSSSDCGSGVAVFGTAIVGTAIE